MEEVSSELAQSSRSNQAWIKAACLERDRDRCVVTGYYDSGEALKKGFTARQLENMDLIYTEACHIVLRLYEGYGDLYIPRISGS